MNNRKRPSLLLIVFLLLESCAVYRPKPIDEHAVSQALAPPDLAAIRIKAEEIKHPILKPRGIDFKKGVSAGDAAIIAVIANPALRARRDQRGIAGAQLIQAGILPNPVFSYSLDVPTGGSDQGTVDAYGLGVDWNILQTLLTRGARMDAARARAASVDLDIAWDEWQTAESAKQHVYRLVYAVRQLALARQEEAGLEKDRSAVKKAVDMGDMTVLDLDAVDAAVRRIHTVVLETGQELKRERLALNDVLGFPPDSKVPLSKDIQPPAFKSLPDLQEIMDGLQGRRLDLLALRMGYRSREANLRAAVRAQFPSIGLGFSHARDTGNVVTTGFSISIELPFFDRNQGRIAIEKATRRQLYDEYLDRVFQARADAAKILADIGWVEKQADAEDKAVEALERLVRASYNGFLEGNVDALSYYAEVERLFSRRLQALKLRQDLADLHIALEITAGEFL